MSARRTTSRYQREKSSERGVISVTNDSVSFFAIGHKESILASRGESRTRPARQPVGRLLPRAARSVRLPGVDEMDLPVVVIACGKVRPEVCAAAFLAPQGRAGD